jgi:hypothetical protein
MPTPQSSLMRHYTGRCSRITNEPFRVARASLEKCMSHNPGISSRFRRSGNEVNHMVRGASIRSADADRTKNSARSVGLEAARLGYHGEGDKPGYSPTSAPPPRRRVRSPDDGITIALQIRTDIV